MTSQTPLIFCAIDTADLDRAKELARMVGPVTGGLKLGLEFFNSFGPQGVEAVRESCPDASVFLDLKLHDIPNTVAGSIRSICRNLAPAYLNVHASGGETMMEAAKAASVDNLASNTETKILAVTILTSIDDEGLRKIGYGREMEEQVLNMAKLTQDSGLDGVVCSAHEIKTIRSECGGDFVLMVPGIRPAGSAAGDQSRVMTPNEAVRAGATHLVIGRPITQAPKPDEAAVSILGQVDR